MPELPEVETTKNALLPHIKNKIVNRINILFPNLRFIIPTHLPKTLNNKKLHNIIRRGKYLILQFDNGDLIIHLGMSGKIRITKEQIYKKHDHFELCFDDVYMRLNDPRRFGCVLWAKNYKTHKLIKNMGVEPLTSDLNENYLFEKSRKKTMNIKTFIMNGKIVVGVGNIYACESLFSAKINPTKSVNKLNKNDYKNLTKTIKQTLKIAIQNGGTTFQDFASVNGELGYFTQQLQVYGRAGEKCKICYDTITKIFQNKRATFYCANCQK